MMGDIKVGDLHDELSTYIDLLYIGSTILDIGTMLVNFEMYQY